MKGEFTERENLGELPEEEGGERGHYPQHARTSNTYKDSIGDIVYANREAAKIQQPGTIPYSGEVISTYDSRPINGLDFSATGYPQWNITGVPPASLTLTYTHNIPGGYIGVLKGYRYEMDPVVPITHADLLLDIFVDGVAQLGYQGLMHGLIVSTFVPCFILAGDGAQITFQWRAPTGIASGVADVRNIAVEFYGNLIQTTGAPLSLEIANKEVGLPVKVEQAAQQSTARRSLRRSRQGAFKRFRFF